MVCQKATDRTAHFADIGQTEQYDLKLKVTREGHKEKVLNAPLNPKARGPNGSFGHDQALHRGRHDACGV